MVNYKKKFLTTVSLLLVSSVNLADNNTIDFTEISLEQLLNIEVFTASKFNQKTSEAPSRVTVVNSAESENLATEH